MNVQVIRTQHHTDEQVRAILEAALLDVADLEPSESLAAPLFEASCRLRGLATVTLLEAAPTPIALPGIRA